MRELGDCDQAGQVAQVGAFVVELDETVVLGVVSAAKRRERLVVAQGCICQSEPGYEPVRQHLLVCIARSMLVINL